MPRSPDFPCPGCGRLLWSGSTSAPDADRLCRPCRRSNPDHRAALAVKRAAAEQAKYQQRKQRLARSCAQCGAVFQPSDPSVRCCSLTCGQLRRNAEGRGISALKSDADRLAARLEMWQRKNRRRRALKRGARSEPYTLAEVAERDETRCGICGDPVDMELRWPDRGSPTIDHVHPIALGGDDVLDNVQLAHFGCNSRKGARAA